MISCIICSRDKKLLADVSLSIEQTIGVPFEIIGIDNTKENTAICKVYNRGASLSKYNCLVFVHEDVLFHTSGWGNILLSCFTDNMQTGCISVAGGIYKTKAPSHWMSFTKGYEFIDQSYLIQHYKNGTQQLRDTWSGNNKKIQEAILMDGVFLVFDKRSGIHFDESIEGFHGYDLAVCLDSINKGYKNYLTHEILLEHLSSGSFNNQWIKAIHNFHKKNAGQFPLQTGTINLNRRDLEKKTLTRFVELSIMSGERSIALYWWRKLFFSNPFYKKHIYLSKVFLSHRKKKETVITV